jgi:hypothetical protein
VDFFWGGGGISSNPLESNPEQFVTKLQTFEEALAMLLLFG